MSKVQSPKSEVPSPSTKHVSDFETFTYFLYDDRRLSNLFSGAAVYGHSTRGTGATESVRDREAAIRSRGGLSGTGRIDAQRSAQRQAPVDCFDSCQDGWRRSKSLRGLSGAAQYRPRPCQRWHPLSPECDTR